MLIVLFSFSHWLKSLRSSVSVLNSQKTSARSSVRPTMGRKSGMKSMGDTKYISTPTTDNKLFQGSLRYSPEAYARMSLTRSCTCPCASDMPSLNPFCCDFASTFFANSNKRAPLDAYFPAFPVAFLKNIERKICAVKELFAIDEYKVVGIAYITIEDEKKLQSPTCIVFSNDFLFQHPFPTALPITYAHLGRLV